MVYRIGPLWPRSGKRMRAAAGAITDILARPAHFSKQSRNEYRSSRILLMRLLIVSSSERTLAVPLSRVREVLEHVDVVPLPRSASGVVGAAPVAGAVIPVISFEEDASLERGPALVIDGKAGPFAWRVKRANAIARKRLKSGPPTTIVRAVFFYEPSRFHRFIRRRQPLAPARLPDEATGPAAFTIDEGFSRTSVTSTRRVPASRDAVVRASGRPRALRVPKLAAPRRRA